MTVGRDYMLKKTTPFGPEIFHRHANCAATGQRRRRGEVLLDRSAARLGIRPSVLVGGAACIMAGLLWNMRSGRSGTTA